MPHTHLSTLWLPILLSGVGVFIISSILHTLLPWHKSDYGKLAEEEKVLGALRGFSIPAGDYLAPCPQSREEMMSPEWKAKREKGPSIIMTVLPTGPFSMTKNLVQWFIYTLVVGVFAGYVAGRALLPGADYLQVFRFAGVTAFSCYSLALAQNSIWFAKSWKSTIKSMLDGLLYGLITAGFFGWLWPR